MSDSTISGMLPGIPLNSNRSLGARGLPSTILCVRNIVAKRFIKTLKKQNSFEALGDNGNYDVFPIACIPTESEEDADWDK